MKLTDCIVIGGGVIGMLTARELALKGMQVSLFDRGLVGQECSWAGGGLLSPLYPWQMPGAFTELASWSQAQYPLLCDSLKSETGIDPQWIQSGLLIFDPDQAQQAQTWAKSHHRPFQILTSDQVVQQEPALQHCNGEVISLPDIAQVRNPSLITALKQCLLQLKVKLCENTEVTGLLMSGNRATGARTSTTEKYNAKNIILANGAWSGQLHGELPVYPVKGQMLCFKAAPGFLQHILLRNGNYIIPRKDGYILAGSTLEQTGFSKDTTEQVRQLLQQFLISLLPAIEKQQFIAQWSGLRPCTPTGLPYIGPHPEIEGVFLNTGHYRNGILLAPGSARLLADTLLQQPSFMALDSFSLQATMPPLVSGM